ncbi:MAG: thioredoxin fold domain-containing protein [Burkholderiales bacterium]|nr:thioredoxin fold domain-containing protein [Burkholderiales bacterium]
MAQILACTLLSFAAASTPALALEHARDLAAASQAAAREQRPIVLFFTMTGCPFCERARRDYLRPLARSEAWQSRARTFEVARDHALIGFDGRRTTGAELAGTYGVRVYPTVAFVDSQGRLLADPLAGYTVPDFYGAYLESRLAAARERLSGR